MEEHGEGTPVGRALTASLGPDLVVRDWTRTNRNWFDAVQLEKRVAFRRAIKKAEEKLYLEQENKSLIDMLKHNNEELDRLNGMKSKFMSMASHDLSNSLMTLQISF